MVEQIWKHPAFTQRDACVVSILYSAAMRRKSYSNNNKKHTSVVACFIPGRLNGMAMNERGFESFTGTNIWRFEQATSAKVLLYPQVCLSRDMTLFDPPLHPFSSCHWHCTLWPWTNWANAAMHCIIHVELKIPLPPDMKW